MKTERRPCFIIFGKKNSSGNVISLITSSSKLPYGHEITAWAATPPFINPFMRLWYETRGASSTKFFCPIFIPARNKKWVRDVLKASVMLGFFLREIQRLHGDRCPPVFPQRCLNLSQSYKILQNWEEFLCQIQ